ncbi:MAG: hypothetical protein II998_05220 [Clostridia bacterium]|nr:hypothetical protein [Clostridia bacterium]MBQ4629359.1 hypothetical protein [Clostridia bacterium]
MQPKVLKTGVAYHGNRILRHVEEDMTDIVRHNMDIVVHMFSHNDWDRHLGVMKNIFDISKERGLEVWVDNWGLGGPPGDKSHFLQYHPEAHQVYSTGEINPVSVCFNSPAYVQFTREWIDAVAQCGGDKIFWDEPRFYGVKAEGGDEKFTCCCETCKKLFEEKYGKKMPNELTDEVEEFRQQSMVNYFKNVGAYAKLKGLENIVCTMPHTIGQTEGLMSVDEICDLGIDPYWSTGRNKKDGKYIKEPYDFVYDITKECVDGSAKMGKDCNIWIQGVDLRAGHEAEIFQAADAAYDAGARTILFWSFRGGESNTYKSDICEKVWHIAGEAMGRIKNRNLDEIRDYYYNRKMNK